MTGPEAATLFYDPAKFQRRGAAPPRLQKTIFGKGGVQGLDGDAHRHRKVMFMSLMKPERVRELGRLTEGEWERRSQKWRAREKIVLYPEARELVTSAVCTWAGVPLEHDEVPMRTRELSALFEGAGAVGPRHWASRLARKAADQWASDIIDDVRDGRLDPPAESAAQAISQHRGPDGELLPTRIAAVELLNVLRPTIAVAVFITHAAHALHHHPQARETVRAGNDEAVELFAQEVRRTYPLFPAVAAVVRQDFEWKGMRFRAGTRALLDLYGTNHDPRAWDAPDEFLPERFAAKNPGQFEFIPQGGGTPEEHHRCAGEAITIELIKVAAKHLTRRIRYDVPDQDLAIDHARLPPLLRSGFVMTNVRPT